MVTHASLMHKLFPSAFAFTFPVPVPFSLPSLLRLPLRLFVGFGLGLFCFCLSWLAISYLEAVKAQFLEPPPQPGEHALVLLCSLLLALS